MITTESTQEMTAAAPERVRVPRDNENDHTHEMAAKRREFIREHTGAELSHLAHHSVDPGILRGNIENFIGVAQVPVGVAGPLRIVGEHANGDFYVPLATTEGSLVASYNRGMRLLTECGGVKTTVLEDAMQRAPVFVLADALEAREFGQWLNENFATIKAQAELTTRHGKLLRINQFQVGPLRYLRFNYSTGDAAGQNLVSKATYFACEWIRANYPRKVTYFMSGNIETDKKHSHMNVLFSRGKRVVAEAFIQPEVFQRVMHFDPSGLLWVRQVQMTGAVLAGSANNGAHAANGLAALFIATGQDAATIAESHAAITYAQKLENGLYYWSITLPSLIVATCGGGTGLATQRQALEMLGCYGAGKALKFAEICAATVLAGETSLAAAMLHGDWVTAHETLGRNRPETKEVSHAAASKP